MIDGILALIDLRGGYLSIVRYVGADLHHLTCSAFPELMIVFYL